MAHATDRQRQAADLVRSPGRSLDESARRRLGARLGHDLRQVRVHDDEPAAVAARLLGARGFAIGRDVVLGERDESLLAHEVAHVVQQERGGRRGDPEAGARLAESGPVAAERLGAAPTGLYLQEAEEERPPPTTVEPAFQLDWGTLRRTRPGFGIGPLLPPLALSPSLVPPAPPTPSLLPTPTGTDAGPAATASLPSRLSVASSGSFSLGLRLGFPELEARTIPGAPPSALSESLRRAEFMNQQLTGQIPTGWEAIDKGQLARAVWGIFSTHLAPDLARSITSGLTTSTGTGGPSYELDLVLFTNFSGGGLSFSVQY
jgi:Domain of unknown function (DUF4157)